MPLSCAPSLIKKGTARFAELRPHFAKWDNLADRMRGFVVVDVERAQVILSPAYDDGATEPELQKQWLKTYTDRLG